MITFKQSDIMRCRFYMKSGIWRVIVYTNLGRSSINKQRMGVAVTLDAEISVSTLIVERRTRAFVVHETRIARGVEEGDVAVRSNTHTLTIISVKSQISSFSVVDVSNFIAHSNRQTVCCSGSSYRVLKVNCGCVCVVKSCFTV